MEAKREQAFVGLFVLIAIAVLIATVFAMSGIGGREAKTYHAYFSFAGGLAPGTAVRYAGGPKVGRIDGLQIDPQDPARMNVTFSVQSGLPIKTDSHVKIMSMSPLGDNHLEILPGTAQAAMAPDGSLLMSESYVDFNSITAQINNIAPQAQELLHSLNDRVAELKETIKRVNDVLSAQNRANVAATLANVHGMIEENRPQVKSVLQNVNSASEKLQPLLDDFRKTSGEATQALDHIDAIIGENRPDIHQAVLELRRALTNMTGVTSRLDDTLDVNSDNIDQILDNMQHVTENLREFTATIKARPSTLIRATNPPEHKPGEQR